MLRYHSKCAIRPTETKFIKRPIHNLAPGEEITNNIDIEFGREYKECNAEEVPEHRRRYGGECVRALHRTSTKEDYFLSNRWKIIRQKGVVETTYCRDLHVLMRGGTQLVE